MWIVGVWGWGGEENEMFDNPSVGYSVGSTSSYRPLCGVGIGGVGEGNSFHPTLFLKS